MTILANYSFLHLIAPKNLPVSIPIRPVTDFTDQEQDLFAYITTKHYMSKEFYSVMINIGASKKSTIGYRQYLAYKNTTTDNTDIDTMQIRAINVQFGIRSAALIRLVIVKTPISLVDFYVIKADTPFLLCLIDIDKLQVYYNNVTDILISPALTLLVTR